jgi:hypothetical protein
MNTVINGKNVNIKPIDFEAICELEDLGFDINTISKKTFSNIRTAVAFHMGLSLSEASAEIEGHIKNGGKIDAFVPLIEAITNSDFFQAITQNTESEE